MLMKLHWAKWLGMLLVAMAGTWAFPAAGASTKAVSYEKNVKPLLVKYCYDCHGDGAKKGGLALDKYANEAAAMADRNTWQMVNENVHAHVMPPGKKKQPTEAERDLITGWIDTAIFKCDCERPDPGRVTIRRLNRVEYNNTIRDLVGVNFQPADDFPADDAGYGFDNIGDVLSVPPVLLEKYLAAAQKVMDAAIVTTGASTNGPIKRLVPEKMSHEGDGNAIGKGGWMLTREGEIYATIKIEQEGEYILRARAYQERAGTEAAKMEFRIDGKAVKVFDVTAREHAAQVYEMQGQAKPGTKRIAAAYLNNFRDPNNPNPELRDRNLAIESLELVGPLGEVIKPELTATHRRIFTREPTAGKERETAQELIGNFARKAYRRPVTKEEVNRLTGLYDFARKQGDGFEGGVKTALEAVLVSPHFLFRGELQPEPNNPRAVHAVNEFALASRLSYFLWSSLPDEELFAQAERGTLRKNLEAQTRRMLKDPKARALVDNFAGQWLQTRNLKLMTPDKAMFPAFDDALRAAMQRETEMFFEAILREDRSVLDFLNADYTFANERLANYYGIPNVKGEAFQKVSLRGTQRSGVISQGSVLVITSNPTRTSPVKRGKWVLENLLGTPPPPPPPDVPELDEKKKEHGTLRQRLEQHRESAICASCHARMDPIGFGLENFDAVGAWRVRDGNNPIDSTGTLVSGEEFKGPADLANVLVKKRKEDFARCLSEKMLTYALGRGMEYYDKCAIEEVAKGLAKNKYKFSSLILEVVKSAPFQKRRGEGDRLAAEK
jgi:hypothetical protein